jgi:hypothetical protein
LAAEFGWSRGASEVRRWTYALAGVALDLLKPGLPIFGAMEFHERKPARSVACWLVFAVLTTLSLWCAYGTTATQLAEKFANQAVASMAETSKQMVLDRLRKQRDALAFTETSAESVKTAEDAVATAAARAADEKKRGGCGDVCKKWEKDEQTARAVLLKAQADRAATIKAAALDAKIAAAEAALAAVDARAAVKEADPQSASMAKAIGADQNLIAALSHVVFAIAIELGSGVGFWLVFGSATTSPGGRPGGADADNGRGAHRPHRRPGNRGHRPPARRDHRPLLPGGRQAEDQRPRPIRGGLAGLQAVVHQPRPAARVPHHVRQAGALAEGAPRQRMVRRV